jgi:hypothetical protein
VVAQHPLPDQPPVYAIDQGECRGGGTRPPCDSASPGPRRP